MTTIAENITRIQQAKTNIKAAIEEKGVEVGQGTIDTYAEKIAQIPSGGSGVDWSELGYSDRPPTIDEGYEYALEIKNNWNASGREYIHTDDNKLLFFPTVDLSNYQVFRLANSSHLIYVGNLNTSNITSCYYAFRNCYALQKIESIDTSNVTTTYYMFGNCYSLQEVPALNTSNVTEASYMFYNCSSIKTIPQLDLNNATRTDYMFANCSKLASVPNLDTSKNTNTNQMFASCGFLETAPEMNTALVTNWGAMFNYCSSLKNVPVYNMSSATGLTNVFANCNSLTDESLYNIIESLLTATSYTGTKKLTTIFGNSTYNRYYTRIQALSNYQDLINAGWS